MKNNESRIQNPDIAHEVALEGKEYRDRAALARRALGLIQTTFGSDINKINTFAQSKHEDEVARLAYGIMQPVDNFPGTMPLDIRTSEEALEDGEYIAELSDSAADLRENYRLSILQSEQIKELES